MKNSSDRHIEKACCEEERGPDFFLSLSIRLDVFLQRLDLSIDLFQLLHRRLFLFLFLQSSQMSHQIISQTGKKDTMSCIYPPYPWQNCSHPILSDLSSHWKVQAQPHFIGPTLSRDIQDCWLMWVVEQNSDSRIPHPQGFLIDRENCIAFLTLM